MDTEDCRSVAKLVGTKVFVNELVAFSKLGKTTKFRDAIIANGTYELFKNGTLQIQNDITMIWNVNDSIKKLRLSANKTD